MTLEQQDTAVGPSIWALLVGIDRYKAANPLRGCVNDVQAMQTFLMSRYGVSSDHIRVLADERATRANIIKEFEEFLIGNPRIRRGDQILFHYSGHGSQMPAKPDEVEPDGLNETLVPHDSRTAGIFDIPDKTLAALLDRLATAKGDQITVILDSCHSGSATRAIEAPASAGVRRVPADQRIPSADLDSGILAAARPRRRGAGPSGWASPEVPYVLLAGCMDKQESNEYEVRVEGHAPVCFGALTYFTLQLLRQMPEDTSYAELHERVAALVNANFSNQTPQCEGDRNRKIFGSARVQRDPFIPVERVDGNVVTLGAGLVHGLRPGTQLALYSPEVRTRADLPPAPLATVEVASAGATTAQAEVQGAPAGPIPDHARALITRHVYEGLRQTVALEAAEGAENQKAIETLRQAIQKAGPGGAESPYLQVVDDPAQRVDLRVKADGGKLGIYSGSYELLVVPEDIRGAAAGVTRAAEAVCRALESIVRYHTLVSLRNEERSQLDGKVRLRLRHHMGSAPPEPLEPGTVGPGGELTLYYEPEREERNRYVVDVINKSEASIYIQVFTLSPDYSITRLYPRVGQQEAIHPNSEDKPFPIGLQRGTTPLGIWLPSGWDASQDYLKAIVTTRPIDLQMLEQGGVNVPPPTRGVAKRAAGSTLEQLLGAVAFGAGTRFAGPAALAPGDEWTLAELALKTVRKYQTAKLDSPKGSVRLSDELTLVKPEGFAGQATVTTLGLSTRGDEGDPRLRPPPGLERLPDAFEPVRRSGTRSIGSSTLVVAFDVDDASRHLISPDNPLRLELRGTRSAEVAELVPVVFDGEDYLLAGYGVEGGNAVEIVHLPRPVVPVGPDGRPTVRGLGRTLRLFIYKKLGRHASDVGLRSAELQDGRAVYSQVQRNRFRPGQRVAVFVHGFISDTRWMVQQLPPFLRSEVNPYDHLLTWDYETFGTGIEDSGRDLALALKQRCGFRPDDGITVDVYAHSMGTIVSRCMIELFGGHAFIDRLVMAGPPNRGSVLASTSRGLIFLITTLINNASVVPILGAANWALKQLYEQGIGLADLAVDSPILKRLNELDEPSDVPYLILAGENLSDEEAKKRLNRIAHKVLDAGLDTLFGEQNDIVIGLSRMKDLRGGAYPNLRVEVLPCDHFHYYINPRGQQAIKSWLTR